MEKRKNVEIILPPKCADEFVAPNSLPTNCANEFPREIPCRQTARTNLLRKIPCRRSARTNFSRKIPCRKSARTNLLRKIPCRKTARTNFCAKFLVCTRRDAKTVVDTNPASFAKQNSVSRAQALRHKYAKTAVDGFLSPENNAFLLRLRRIH